MDKWRDHNFGLHPSDPEYETDYDRDEDFDRYMDAVEEKYERAREKED